MHLKRLGQVLFAAAVALAAIAGYGVHSHIRSIEASYGTTVKALVAAQAIPAHTAITEQMLQSRYIPLQAFLPGMVREEDKAALIGQTLLVPLRPGDVLTRSMTGVTSDHDPDTRSYPVYQSERVIFPQDLATADQVDLLASYKEKDGTQVSKVILKGIRVVSVKSEGRQQAAVLALSPADAETLAWYENFGQQLRLLRVG